MKFFHALSIGLCGLGSYAFINMLFLPNADPAIGLICGGVLFVAGFIIGLFDYDRKMKKKAEEHALLAALQNDFQSKKYELTEKPLATRIYKGDQLILGTRSGDVVVTVANTVGDLSLETPAGIQHIELSEELEVDVDGDSKPELIVYVSDVSTGTNDRGAEVRILLKNASNAAAGETKTSEIPSVEELSPKPHAFPWMKNAYLT